MRWCNAIFFHNLFILLCLPKKGDNVRSSIKRNERGSRHVLPLHILEYLDSGVTIYHFFTRIMINLMRVYMLDKFGISERLSKFLLYKMLIVIIQLTLRYIHLCHNIEIGKISYTFLWMLWFAFRVMYFLLLFT